MSLAFDEFQGVSVGFDTTDGMNPDFKEDMPKLALMGLGMAGEAGEAADAIKKAWRDDGFVSEERRRKIMLEMGDCLWYISIIADKLGIRLSEVAQANMDKLADRRSRGVLNGQGDDR